MIIIHAIDILFLVLPSLSKIKITEYKMYIVPLVEIKSPTTYILYFKYFIYDVWQRELSMFRMVWIREEYYVDLSRL